MQKSLRNLEESFRKHAHELAKKARGARSQGNYVAAYCLDKEATGYLITAAQIDDVLAAKDKERKLRSLVQWLRTLADDLENRAKKEKGRGKYTFAYGLLSEAKTYRKAIARLEKILKQSRTKK